MSDQMPKSVYVYFVAYLHSALGAGNLELTTEKPITDIGEIRDLEDKMNNQLPGAGGSVVTNFVLLRTQEVPEQATEKPQPESESKP